MYHMHVANQVRDERLMELQEPMGGGTLLVNAALRDHVVQDGVHLTIALLSLDVIKGLRNAKKRRKFDVMMCRGWGE